VIHFTTGDILEADAEALVNTVNCVGVMGRGVALHFKGAYPDNFKAYAIACDRGEVEPGRMFVFETDQLAPRWIINFPTKRHWRGKSRMGDIEAGMEALVEEIRNRGIRSIAIPPLGSGLGGLDWEKVKGVIERGLAEVPDVEAVIYEPGGAGGEMTAATKPEMTPGRAALVGLMRRYLGAMMDSSITLLEIHKLMYFLQEAGESLRLDYQKGTYGPYAKNLRHVLQRVNGYLISGYTADADSPNEQVELLPGAVEEADAFLEDHPDTKKRFDRVAELVDGFETPFGLELLATAHWVVVNGEVTDGSVDGAFYAWGPNKAQFTPEQIEIAVRRLSRDGWLGADPVR
jgi:O-acetyl-ADP-ribose deacetylase (regulator of RNase III)